MSKEDKAQVTGRKFTSRAIAKEFVEELRAGRLKELTDSVRRDKSLLMCFRGDYINVYYKGHSMFKVEKQKADYKVSFDFNHARFSPEWKNKWEVLKGMGYSLNEKNELTSYKKEKKFPSNKIQIHISKINHRDFWTQSIEILKEFMDDYFDADKRYDFFYNIELERSKNVHLEKQRQQQIMSSNQDFNNGYFIYDMEFSQANENRDVPKSGRFDMLGLKLEGKTVKLLFIELKSTLSACREVETGIEAHYEGISKYISKEKLIDIRIKEAEDMYKIYCELDLVSNKIENIDLRQAKAEVEILFILTDKAVKYRDRRGIPIIKLENNCWYLN